MTEYDNTNSGVLYRNDRKERQNQPDHRGSLHVKCPCCEVVSEFWLSAWVKEAGPSARNPGSKFFSLAIQPKEDQQPTGNSDAGKHPITGEDIPF